MNSRVISIILASLITINVWGAVGVIQGEGRGHDIMTATDMAYVDLGRKIETKVYSRVRTTNINGKQNLAENITSITNVRIEGADTEVIKTPDGYIVYCTLDVDAYIDKCITKYREYAERSHNEGHRCYKAGYAYLAFTMIDNPIMDYFVEGNERAKQCMKETVDKIRQKYGNGNFVFSVWNEFNYIVTLDVPEEWETGNWNKIPKPVKFAS